MKELAVFIPCFQPDDNRKKNLEFIYQRLSEKNIDVTIVVQGKNSEYYDKFKQVKFFRGPENFNKSFILNQCLDFAHESKFLAFMDADIYFPLDSLFQIHDEDEIIKPFSECAYLTKEKTREFMEKRKTEIPRDSKRISALGGGALIMRSDLIRSNNLKFDENFYEWGWEDIDFGDQIRLKGLKVRTIDQPAVHLYHEPKPTNNLNYEYYRSKPKIKKPIVHVFSSENSDVECIRSFSKNKTREVILLDCARGDRLNDPHIKFFFMEKEKTNASNMIELAKPYVKNNGWLIYTKGSFKAYENFYENIGTNEKDYVVIGNGEGFAVRIKEEMKSVFIKVQNGLANRLRCLSSFANFADNTNKKLFVCWTRGPGFSDEKFEDLFEYWPENVSFISAAEYDSHSKKIFKLHEDMIKDETCNAIYRFKDIDKAIKIISEEDFCYEGHSRLEWMFPKAVSGSDQDFLCKLIPQRDVAQKVSEISSQFTENTIGVHVRRGDATFSPWKRHYRISTLDSFIQAMKKELINPNVNFYLSTDCPDTEEELKKKFPNLIICQNKPLNDVEDHSLPKQFQKEALIDMLCLSKTKKIIGSYWSSFSSCSANFTGIPLETAKQTYKNNVSVITACKDRKNALLISIQSWLRFDEIAEIIVVDWSSSEDMKFLENIDKRVKVVRVHGKEEFSMAKSYNLASRHVTKDFILKMDVDYVLSPYWSIFDKYNLQPGEFLTGHWSDEKKENSLGFLKFLNGFILIRTLDFKSVMGYSEDIVDYGFDDEDLYNKLQKKGFNRKLLNHNEISVFHIPHSDNERIKNFKNKSIENSMATNLKKLAARTKKPIVIYCADKERNTGNIISKKGICDLLKGEKVFAPDLKYDAKEINNKCQSLVVSCSSSNLIGKQNLSRFIQFIEKIEIPIIFLGLGIHSDTYEPPKNLCDSSKRLIDIIVDRKLPIGIRGKNTRYFLEQLGINSGVFEVGCASNLINKEPDFCEKLGQKFQEKVVSNIILNQNDIFSSNPIKVIVERILFEDLINKQGIIVQQSNPFMKELKDKEGNINLKYAANIVKKILAPSMTPSDFYESLRMYKIYENAEEWMRVASKMDLSIGLRMQGNMAAMQSGCPSIWIYHDIRTKELSEIMSLPRISLEEAYLCKDIEEIKIKAKIDLEEYKRKRKKLRRNTYELFEQFGLDDYFHSTD